MSKQTDSMYATLVGIVLAVIVASIILVVVRFLFGGSEDTWICSGGQWVMHGNPTASQPAILCAP